MAPSVMTRATAGGLFVSLLSVPYLYYADPGSPVLLWRIVLLPPVTIIVLQAGLAWTPLAEGRQMISRAPGWRELLLIVLLGFGIALADMFYLDAVLAEELPSYLPESRVEVLVRLPWSVLFQPLLLVAGVYGFAVRLGRRAWVGMGAVVLVQQLMLNAQTADAAPGRASVLILAAGVSALVDAAAYRRCGLIGPVLLAFVRTCRFLAVLPPG